MTTEFDTLCVGSGKGGIPSSLRLGAAHCKFIQRYDADVVKILVAHHPFDAGSRAALDVLTRAGIDVILTGHLHVSSTSHTARRHNLTGRGAVVVEAGTATSTRLREMTNAFNVVRVDARSIVVERHEWARGAGFQLSDRQQFDRVATGWQWRV